MAEYNCEACETLKQKYPNFVVNGVTDTECASLKNDTGLNPSSGHDDCKDLDLMNDCLIGNMEAEIETQDVCDWKPFMQRFIPNVWTMYKGIICAVCGIWTNIKNLWAEIQKLWAEFQKVWTEITNIWEEIRKLKAKLDAVIAASGGGSTYVTAIKTYNYTVPAGNFTPFGHVIGAEGTAVVQWFSGGGGNFIRIPIAEMESVNGVWAQTHVVGNRPTTQSVAVQSAVRDGDYLVVDFDAYIWHFAPFDGYPYDLPVEFLVVGRKRLDY